MVKNIFFDKKFLVVWKYAQMHKNTFLTTPDFQFYFFQKKFLVVWKYAQMHQNTLLTTLDGKHVFNNPRRSKISLLKKSFWWSGKYAQMHKNTLVTTLDSKKYLFRKKVSGCPEVCANESKHVFNNPRRSKIFL
jgi:hypothetical protein